jgi:membrane protease YdiL (CAAX protease family)
VNAASWFPRWLPPESVALFAVLVLLIIAVPAMGALVAARLRSAEDTPARKRARYARTMLVLWTMTALAYYALQLHGLAPADIGLRPPVHFFWYAVGPLIVAVLLSTSGAGRGDISSSYARAIRPVIPNDAVDWCWFVAVAATAAICEEFLYRGYALTQIAALTHSVVAGVVLSSLAFGLGHAYQGRIGMAGTAITGLLYSVLFLASGSLVPCMLAHFMQDIFGAALLARRLRSTAAEVGPIGAPGEEGWAFRDIGDDYPGRMRP